MNRRFDPIDPDVVFLDAKNLPSFDTSQLEGRIERSLPRFVFILLIIAISIIVGACAVRLWYLQIAHGAEFKNRADNNLLQRDTVFSDRGIIEDRTGVPLAWNDPQSTSTDFSLRRYKDDLGLSHILGYVKYPAKDTSGVYYSSDYLPQAGIEKEFNDTLKGIDGVKLTESDVHNNVVTESILEPAKNGAAVTLSIDSRLQTILYNNIKKTAEQVDFAGGAGLMMDLQTGELVAHVTYPEFNSEIMTNGTSAQIRNELSAPNHPFLDRVSTGLYAPGSIVKPYVAMAALSEGVIDPNKKILSTGSISIPNPYDPSKPTVFRDWRAQGWVDMREALEWSSDVYFYEVGGGFQDQKGLGIANIEKYYRMFGFGEGMQVPFFKSQVGSIPSPDWKAANFKGEMWRVGDTYLTSIGQYGMQVTPIQVVRAVSTVATGGTRIEPTIIHGDTSNKQYWKQVPLPAQDYQVVREGMRMSATDGVARALAGAPIPVAAKTGTAELGISKAFVNSWVMGFYPYEKPRYAFVILMEHGPRANLIGAPYVMSQVFNDIKTIAPEYLGTGSLTFKGN